MNLELIAQKIATLMAGLEELQRLVVDSQPSLPADAQAAVDAEVCLDCGLPKDARAGKFVRGLHEACRRRVLRSIASGEITEYEAIARGLIAPVAKSGRKPLPSKSRTELDAKKRRKTDD